MECRITVLCENTVQGLGFLGEHGFSAFIETPGQNILFDTGQGFSLIQNSLRLQKDLRHVSKVVLSHGHLDHVGGLLAFLGLKGACPVIAHPDIFNERFSLMPAAAGEEKPVSIGMPWPQAYLTTWGAQFEWRRDFTEVAPGVCVILSCVQVDASEPWESCHACHFCRISFEGRQGLHQLILHPLNAVENLIAKTIFPDAIPNVLHWVELRTVRGKEDQCHVAGHTERLCLMPSSAVHDH